MAAGSDAEFPHPLRVSRLLPVPGCLSWGEDGREQPRITRPVGEQSSPETDEPLASPGSPRMRGEGKKKFKTLRYMNCEIKSKYSNKESHNNISKDVYQGLKLNTDFFINPNTKCNKVLWNVKYNLHGKKCAPLP